MKIELMLGMRRRDWPRARSERMVGDSAHLSTRLASPCCCRLKLHPYLTLSTIPCDENMYMRTQLYYTCRVPT